MSFKLLMSKINKLIVLLRNKGFFGTYNFLKDYYLPKTYPCSAKIEITTRCNLNCVMCAHGSLNFGSWKDADRNMSFEKFKLIINNFYGLKSINFAGLGENFLNEDFIKMIRYVRSKNISVDFFSNFSLVDENIIEELIEIGVNRIYVSIDGATKETYEKIRMGSDFEKVINNVKITFRLKKEKNKNFPEVFFYYVVNKYNINEIVKYIGMVHSLRGGQKTTIILIGMSDLFLRKDSLSDKTLEEVVVPEEIIQEVNRKSEELDVPVIWTSNMLEHKTSTSKCTAYLEPFISINGEVFPCCIFLSLKSFKKEMIFGNVFEHNFKEIWKSKKYKNFRNLLREGKNPLFCRDCSVYNVNKY